MWVFLHALITSARRNTTLWARSATLRAQSTASKLGRDPNVHRNIPAAPLLAPAAESERKNARRPKISMPKKMLHTLHKRLCVSHTALPGYLVFLKNRDVFPLVRNATLTNTIYARNREGKKYVCDVFSQIVIFCQQS